MDYMFLNIGVDDSMVPILVVKDSLSKQIWAGLAEGKGRGVESIMKFVGNIIDELGYSKIKLRSDQEPAMKDVQNKALEDNRRALKKL